MPPFLHSTGGKRGEEASAFPLSSPHYLPLQERRIVFSKGEEEEGLKGRKKTPSLCLGAEFTDFQGNNKIMGTHCFWLFLTQSVIKKGFPAQKGEFFIRAVPVEGGGGARDGENGGSGGGKRTFSVS